MKKKFDRVYQFRIELLGTTPLVWRRIQVPEPYTFWDLHVAIQDSMGWEDYHLHEFQFKDSKGFLQRIGLPAEEMEELEDFDEDEWVEWKEKIAKWFPREGMSCLYIYDFGDGWRHQVTLEKILPREADKTYPLCLEGEMACPPEDSGGIGGYQEILDFLKDPGSVDPERAEDLKSWLEEFHPDYDPEHFDPREVRFDDPVKRKRRMFY